MAHIIAIFYIKNEIFQTIPLASSSSSENKTGFLTFEAFTSETRFDTSRLFGAGGGFSRFFWSSEINKATCTGSKWPFGGIDMTPI